MREHLRHAGWFSQLFGKTRPILLGLFGLLGILGILSEEQWPLSTLFAFALLNTTQILLKRQPYPVCTPKALVLVGTSLVLSASAAFIFSQLPIIHYQLFIVFLQPLILTLALTLFLPIDHFLKHRILAKAKTLRAQFPHLSVIGITGSVGKTTTKELLAHVLKDRNPLVTPEHVNTEMGVAQWLIRTLNQEKESWRRRGWLRRDPRLEPLNIGKGELMRGEPLGSPLMIVEMGAYRKGEIALLCSIVQPTIGIITAIGTQHLGLFGSERAIQEAKGELLTSLPLSGHAFLNGDSEAVRQLKSSSPYVVTTVGTKEGSDLRAEYIQENPQGISFVLQGTSFSVPLCGSHQVTNVLLAIATARHLGMSLQEIAQKLQSFCAPAHTFTVRTERGVTILDDTHNASPMSFRAALDWANHRAEKPKILLTPGIIELGETEELIHSELGRIATGIIYRAIILDAENARSFQRGYGKIVEHFTKTTAKAPPGSLLLCLGRIPQNVISSVLPNS